MTTEKQSAMDWWDSVSNDPRFNVEQAAADLTVRVANLLNQAFAARPDLDQNALASLLGVTKGRVSQVLHGDGNVHVATAAKYLRALGYEVELSAVPVDKSAVGLDAFDRSASKRHGFKATYADEVGIYVETHYLSTRSATVPVPIGDLEYVGPGRSASAQSEVGQAQSFHIKTSLQKVEAL